MLRPLQLTIYAILLATLTTTAVITITDLPQNTRANIAQSFNNQTTETLTDSFGFLTTYTLTTPELTYDWLAPSAEHVWLLERIPVPQTKHLFLLTPVWFIIGILQRQLWRTRQRIPTKIIQSIALWTLGTILAWILILTALYYANIYYATQLGIPTSELIEARQSVTEASTEHFWITLGIELIFFTTTLFERWWNRTQ